MKNNLNKNSDRLNLKELLKIIYHDHDSEELNVVLSQLSKILFQYQNESGFINENRIISWNQNHSVLITYADSVQREGEPTLVTLNIILEKYFQDLSKVVHILPFLKSTSDGGFAVSNHKLLQRRNPEKFLVASVLTSPNGTVKKGCQILQLPLSQILQNIITLRHKRPP